MRHIKNGADCAGPGGKSKRNYKDIRNSTINENICQNANHYVQRSEELNKRKDIKNICQKKRKRERGTKETK